MIISESNNKNTLIKDIGKKIQDNIEITNTKSSKKRKERKMSLIKISQPSSKFKMADPISEKRLNKSNKRND